MIEGHAVVARMAVTNTIYVGTFKKGICVDWDTQKKKKKDAIKTLDTDNAQKYIGTGNDYVEKPMQDKIIQGSTVGSYAQMPSGLQLCQL